MLVTLFLTPWPAQAQGIGGFAVYSGANFKVGALVTLTGSASH